MNDNQRRTCLRILNHFGTDNQKKKCCEELFELGTELMHDLDGRGQPVKIREELADVIILAEQLRIVYGARNVDQWIEHKLLRTIVEIGGDGPKERDGENGKHGVEG